MALAQLNILVVDDEREVGDGVAAVLTSEGHAARSLVDPTAALDALRQTDYHVVVVDIMMPQLSGLDLVEKIRDMDGDVAIVVLTGHPSVETAAASIRYDVSAYIRKPVDSTELLEALDRIARKKGMVREREAELHQAIGRAIREYRKARGLTLKQVARRTNLSVSLLSQIERAESSASVSSLYKVAAALDVPINHLFQGF